MSTEIDCPVARCTGRIVADTRALLDGAGFACDRCGGVMTLSEESRTEAPSLAEQLAAIKGALNAPPED